MDLSSLSATELVQRLNSREVTATECVEFFLKRIEQSNESLHAFIGTSKTAIEAATRLDARRAAGKPVGPLAGLPVALKDNICTAHTRTTAGSKILERFIPPYNATVVNRLIEADAIVIGKTNLDEFAMGSSTEHSFFGPTRNPWHRDHVPGGSSGGSAAAIASRLSPMALGSDTGGSIRQPAAFCGITGLKPTYGRVSRFGLIAFASSLDQIGPMAGSAEDCALMMNLISGHDPRDATSVRQGETDYLKSLNQPLQGLRIGICRDHFTNDVASGSVPFVRDAIETLKDLGAQTTEIELRHSNLAVATYYLIAACEASSNLARYDGVRYTLRHANAHWEQMICETRADGLGREVKNRIMLGTFALNSENYEDCYLHAAQLRQLIKSDYDQAFEHVDLIVGATTPDTAFRIGALAHDSLSMVRGDVFTVSANLAGIPAISIPCGFSEFGLPIGLQMQSAAFNESGLLRAAHQFQTVTDWHQRRPPA